MPDVKSLLSGCLSCVGCPLYDPEFVCLSSNKERCPYYDPARVITDPEVQE